MYRDIFNREFNLSFHVPKKDQCLLCHKYHEEKRKHTLTEELEQEYLAHQERKQELRAEKAKDKQMAKENPNLHVATFDLEAVLSTPCSLVSQTHYKRKLAVYNLTVFSLADKQAECYVWNETEGKKGACEIGTCLLLHLKALPPNITHVVLYSDTCSGQNRNQYAAAALQYVAQKLPNIETIDQTFLESGHTHMECDSMHACIERAKKNVTIHIPDQWNTVLQMARPSAPYTVVPIKHSDIQDFKMLASSSMRNTKTDISGTRILWTKIKWIRYGKGETDTLFFKYTPGDPFNLLKTRGSTGRRRRQPAPPEHLSARYSRRQPVSSAKKADLLDLCRLGIVPEQHHNFYHKLPSENSAPDRLAEPDATEDTDTDED
ncbi:hypothetical protein V1264_007365 [Littorina saxatilis]